MLTQAGKTSNAVTYSIKYVSGVMLFQFILGWCDI